jgi:Transglycosylase SLT domain
MTSRINPGYQASPKLDRISDGKIREAIVKNAADATCHGRLEVWIPELGGDQSDPSTWFIASYASPFAGATTVDDNEENGKTYNSTQTSYGMWFVPPDIGNTVLVCFANGEPSKCFWFACVFQHNMNHMIPAVASDHSFDTNEKILPPVAEYNKKDNSIDPNSPLRPRFEPLHQGISKQGLYNDFERGPSSTSARRESPSKVFGIITPRSNSMHIDDDEENEFIRFRTRSGTQIIINETTGFVYINSKHGNSWVEISDDGLDLYSRGNISLRSEQDINIRADKNVNIHSGENTNILATNIKSEASSSISSLSGGNIFVTATGDLQLSSTNNNISASNIHLKASSLIEEASTISQKGANISRDGQIDDNAGKSISANDAVKATQGKLVSHIDILGTIKSPVSRLPGHEPWAHHPTHSNIDPPRGDIGEMNPTTNIGPNPVTRKTTQVSGDGQDTAIKPTMLSGVTTKVGTIKVDNTIIMAIKKGCSVTGMEFGFMMAMADKESSFRPNVAGSGSSAFGLYQFTNSTWTAMVKKYGGNHGISDTLESKSNPTHQAILAGYYAKEAKANMERQLKRTVSGTDLYINHFLGSGGSIRFLKCAGTDMVSKGISDGALAASGNRSVFYKKNGDMKTIQETYDDLNIFFAGKEKAYAAIENQNMVA